MTLQEATEIAHKVDTLYFAVYIEWALAKGECPCGPPGVSFFDNKRCVLSHIKSRRNAIEKMNADLVELRKVHPQEDAEIENIARELGIIQ